MADPMNLIRPKSRDWLTCDNVLYQPSRKSYKKGPSRRGLHTINSAPGLKALASIDVSKSERNLASSQSPRKRTRIDDEYLFSHWF
ncbi:hypothetical protein GLAREA_00910 [Glarea lozoyensis ATCC 20868]|uniref:Uncharacterized protein n=1 Tax=Glarea lozoyensis (strain ATCC 20868 / MF5171) TaxID=1116229 RepID=S3CVU5_GLAL2|nr:uncharacterized protein GLAREA_00910 [Glarea lozoyensis ATCC 20868]EPE29750.1 hypothetical protein GLAREA_00910 [Glarea lozoyensis ATCC 20868]